MSRGKETGETFRKSTQSAVPLALFVAIGAFGIFLRFWNLDEFPLGIYKDEAFNGYDALRSLATGRFSVFYPANYGREGLLIWLIAATQSVMEPSALSLRLPPAVIGSLTVVTAPFTCMALLRFFRVSPSLFGNSFLIVAAATMFFLASSFWHVNFSRMAFRAILDPFLSAVSILLICAALSRGRHASLACLAGAVLGLGLYGYATFKFLVFPVLFLIAYALLQKRPYARLQAVLILSSAVLVSSPLLLFILETPNAYFHRLESVSIFSKDSPLMEFVYSTLSILQMHVGIGDRSPRHNLGSDPQLHSIVFLFFLSGFAYLISIARNVKDRRFFGKSRECGEEYFALFVLIFWISMLLPPILTHQDHPHSLRAIGLILPTVMIAGIGVGFIVKDLRRYASDFGSRWILAVMLIAGVISLDAFLDYHYRFVHHPYTAEAFNLRAALTAQRLRDAPADMKKLIVVEVGRLSDDDWAVQHFLFFADGDLASRNASLVEVSDLPYHPEIDKALIFAPHSLEHAVAPLVKDPDRLFIYYSSLR